MEIAAAVLAGGVTFFAGLFVGLFPPPPSKAARSKARLYPEQNKAFENFLKYDGEIQP